MTRTDPLREALNGVVTKSTWRADNTVLIHDGTAWNTLVGQIVMATNGERESATCATLLDALEAMVRQFAYWADGKGGSLWTGGLSALENAFDLLGWDDPHPVPDMACDEPGCSKKGMYGWSTRPGGTGMNGGYRRTCYEHKGKTA